MKFTSSFLLLACLTASAPIFAQTAPDLTAPPPPAPANLSPDTPMRPFDGSAVQRPSSNKSSRVEGIDYAPDGSIHSLYLRDGAFIHLSPQLGRQAGEFLRKGVKISATGDAQTFARQTTLEANSITVAGRTFVTPNLPAGAQLAAGTPPPPSMPGVGASRREPGRRLERGPGGPGPIAPPPPLGPRSGRPAGPPPPPPDAVRSDTDPNTRPGVTQPGNPVPPPPPAAPAIDAAPQPGATPVAPPSPDAPAPQF